MSDEKFGMLMFTILLIVTLIIIGISGYNQKRLEESIIKMKLQVIENNLSALCTEEKLDEILRQYQ